MGMHPLNIDLLKKGYSFMLNEVTNRGRNVPNLYSTFYLYKITNIKNGKFYIGQTHDIWKRIRGHKNPDYGMIRKLGNIKHWRVEILDVIALQAPERPGWAMEVNIAESKLIIEAKKTFGILCVNTIIYKSKAAFVGL